MCVCGRSRSDFASVLSSLNCNRKIFASNPSIVISILNFFGMPDICGTTDLSPSWDEEVLCVMKGIQ